MMLDDGLECHIVSPALVITLYTVRVLSDFQHTNHFSRNIFIERMHAWGIHVHVCLGEYESFLKEDL